MDQPTMRYAAPARILHWMVAILVVIQFYFGWASEQETDNDASFALIRVHFQLGMTIVASGRSLAPTLRCAARRAGR